MKKILKFILKVFIGIIIWLILIDIEWTFLNKHYIENLIFIMFGIFLFLLITSGIYWIFKKKRIFKFTVFGTLYILTLIVTMIIVNLIYDKVTENQFISLLKDIEKYRVKNGYIPKKLNDLPTNHYNIYGIVPHEFIYEGYKPHVWNGVGFDESETESKTEKMIGFKTPISYEKYRISDDEQISKVIERVKKNVW